MPPMDEAMLRELLDIFAVEAEEHLNAVSAALLALEKNPDGARRAEIIEAAFRRVHTLKGAARAVDQVSVARLCHALESVFAELQESGEPPPRTLLDLLHDGFAQMRHTLSTPESALTGDQRQSVTLLIDRLERPTSGEEEALPSPARTFPAMEAAKHSMRVAAAKLESLLRQSEELVGAKLTANQRVSEMTDLWAELTLRMAERQAQRARVSETELLLQDDQLFQRLAGELATMARNTRRDMRSLTKMVDGLRDEAKTLIMVPFAALFDGVPQMVRDLSRRQHKEVEVVIGGRDIEVDRRVQEEFKEALLHLVRNAVDHGVDLPDARERAGKPRTATLSITARHRDSANVEIVVADDGNGIDPAGLRASAISKGVATADDIMLLSDDDARDLIFRSGVSTSPTVTDLSGRGLGMAIVQEKIENLGGRIAIESRAGSGTAFHVFLPMSLASMRGVVVEAGKSTFIIPTRHVDRVARVPAQAVQRVENLETVRIDARTTTLLGLAETLGLPPTPRDRGAQRLFILVRAAARQMAFEIDAVIAEQEVLVKPLGWQLDHVRNIGGAAILGSGQLALMLDIHDLMAAAERGPPRLHTPPAPISGSRTRILVVEDSITARTLFKHVLAGADYSVHTAADGIEAWSEIQTGQFDLVLADIEMPRLNGIELTQRIRQNDAFADLPVILISSLDSREDKERGVDAGANAYIIKRSFDQTDLLETIRRLI